MYTLYTISYIYKKKVYVYNIVTVASSIIYFMSYDYYSKEILHHSNHTKNMQTLIVIRTQFISFYLKYVFFFFIEY